MTPNRRAAGAVTKAPERAAAINQYVTRHNANPTPSIRTKSASDILQKLIRANSRFSSWKKTALRYRAPLPMSSLKYRAGMA